MTGAGCIVLIAVLSLLPGDWQAHTGYPGKLEHFVAYCGATTVIGLGAATRRPLAGIVLAFVMFAGVLEVLQIWPPGRDPAFLDFVASCLGAASGGLFVHFLRR